MGAKRKNNTQGLSAIDLGEESQAVMHPNATARRIMNEYTHLQSKQGTLSAYNVNKCTNCQRNFVLTGKKNCHMKRDLCHIMGLGQGKAYSV